jgi:hypothetical protein
MLLLERRRDWRRFEERDREVQKILEEEVSDGIADGGSRQAA